MYDVLEKPLFFCDLKVKIIVFLRKFFFTRILFFLEKIEISAENRKLCLKSKLCPTIICVFGKIGISGENRKFCPTIVFFGKIVISTKNRKLCQTSKFCLTIAYLARNSSPHIGF